MLEIPESECQRFTNILAGQAQRFNLSPTEYIRKVWYHEEASKLGEYVAMVLTNELLSVIVPVNAETKEMIEIT